MRLPTLAILLLAAVITGCADGDPVPFADLREEEAGFERSKSRRIARTAPAAAVARLPEEPVSPSPLAINGESILLSNETTTSSLGAANRLPRETPSPGQWIEPEPESIAAPNDPRLRGGMNARRSNPPSGTIAAENTPQESAMRSAPSTANLRVFRSTPPYFIATKSGTQRVRLGIYGTDDDIERSHDFVGPFINPRTGRTDALSIQVPVQADSGTYFATLTDASAPPVSNRIPGDRAAFASGVLKLGYHAYDPPSADKCRAMINSWPVPTRTRLIWDLSLRLGDAASGMPWPSKRLRTSPTLIWQLKADPGWPSMGIYINPSPQNEGNVRLTFFQRINSAQAIDHQWSTSEISLDSQIEILIEATLDDRDAPHNVGKLRVWVNGVLIASRDGRNLIQDMNEPHRWAFGVYLPADANPQSQARITTWTRSRLLVD